MSAGEIDVNASESSRKGAIFGYNNANSNINKTNCYWSDKVGLTDSSSKMFYGDNFTDTEGNNIANILNNGYTDPLYSWKVITFKCNGGNIDGLATKMIMMRVNILPTPYKDYSTFIGWFTDNNVTNAVSVSTLINDATLYAKWKSSVTLCPDNGEICSTQTIEYGENVNLPTPTKEMHTFSGWYINGTNEKIDGIFNMPSSNTVLVAKWTANKYTLKICPENGIPCLSKIIKYGETVTFSTPTKKDPHLVDGMQMKHKQRLI